MSIGQRIAELRVRNDMSQNQMAQALHVSRQAVSKWENDQTAPDTLNLIRLADLLNSDVEYIATGRSALTPSPSVVTVEKIVEKPVEVEKIVQVEKVVQVDRFHDTVIEKPVVRKVLRTKYVRNPVEYVAVLLLGIAIGLLIGYIM